MRVRFSGSMDLYASQVLRIEVHDATPVEVAKTLDTVGCRVAILGAERVPLPSVGPQKLELYAESGDYLLMLSEYTQDGDVNVRTLRSQDLPPGMVTVLGNQWSAGMVSHDIEIVKRAFVEFVLTGNVSPELLR
jgi:hypothetical protein